jgi:hypothetical protein
MNSSLPEPILIRGTFYHPWGTSLFTCNGAGAVENHFAVHHFAKPLFSIRIPLRF